MPKYMVITKGKYGTLAMFFDTFAEAEEYYMDEVYGAGSKGGVYECMKDDEGDEYYELMYSLRS